MLTLAAITGPLPGQEDLSKFPSLQSGSALYRAYCASCHGLAAKGDGAVAEALQMRPADLTRLSTRNGGTFPNLRIERLLGGSGELPVDGSKTMPVWGPGLRLGNRSGSLPKQRVKRLVEHLESIQNR